jgi:hypothetical protein
MAGEPRNWSPEPEDNIQTQTATHHWGSCWLSSCCWKTGKKKNKTGKLPNHLVRLRQSFCLNTNTRTGCWRSSTRTTKTENLLFLTLEFFFFLSKCLSYSLFVNPLPLPVDFFDSLSLFFFYFSITACFVHWLLVHHLSLLIALVLYFFSFLFFFLFLFWFY